MLQHQVYHFHQSSLQCSPSNTLTAINHPFTEPLDRLYSFGYLISLYSEHFASSLPPPSNTLFHSFQEYRAVDLPGTVSFLYNPGVDIVALMTHLRKRVILLLSHVDGHMIPELSGERDFPDSTMTTLELCAIRYNL